MSDQAMRLRLYLSRIDRERATLSSTHCHPVSCPFASTRTLVKKSQQDKNQVNWYSEFGFNTSSNEQSRLFVGSSYGELQDGESALVRPEDRNSPDD